MKRLFFGTILILAGCLAAAAQTSNCPEIKVLGPNGVTAPGDTMSFTATAGASDENSKLEYSWTVSAGTIESGQGTPSITVRSTKEMANSNVTVTLKMVGFPAGCSDSASETGSIAPGPACGMAMDEFGRLSRNNIKARIDNFYIRLNNDPEAEGLIRVELDEKESRALKLAYLNSIYDAILFLRQDPSRVTFEILQRDYETATKLWAVPAGADFPVLGHNPILIKGEDFKQKIKHLFPGKKQN